jgi:hypothetical protein
MNRQILVANLAALLAALLWLAPTATSGARPGNSAEVDQGTRFLVLLENKLSTRTDKAGKRFKARTAETLVAADGTMLPAGAEIRGHVSRVEPAGVTGRARLWLSFDEIKTPAGKVPLVASVASVPGEHSVRRGDSKEGEIEARTSKGAQEIQAAAVGAAIGAAAGAAAKGGKGALIGAAVGAAAGFLVASGMGQELELQKGSKVELQLDRPLYIGRR